MIINEELIYTGENFNIVFDDNGIIEKAEKIIKSIIAAEDELEIDSENNKIFVEEGSVGDNDAVVSDICKALAVEFPENSFYGHAYYDDYQCAYESCADYQFDNGKLHMELFESENGNGFCPECGEQLVCFDEFNPDETYHCEDCDIDVSAEDMFEGVLPVRKVIELQVVDGELR